MVTVSRNCNSTDRNDYINTYTFCSIKIFSWRGKFINDLLDPPPPHPPPKKNNKKEWKDKKKQSKGKSNGKKTDTATIDFFPNNGIVDPTYFINQKSF